MDKNMINIDDLFRQRLADAEVPQQPGSWSRMKGLLDEHMPQNATVPANRNWRRSFGLLAGVILLAALSVGGYQMSQSFFGEGAGDGTVASNDAAPAIRTGVAGMADEVATGRTAVEANATNANEESVSANSSYTSSNTNPVNNNSGNNNRSASSGAVATISQNENVAENKTQQNATKRNNFDVGSNNNATADSRGNNLNSSNLNNFNSSSSLVNSASSTSNNSVPGNTNSSVNNTGNALANSNDNNDVAKGQRSNERAPLLATGDMQQAPSSINETISNKEKLSVPYRKIVKQQSLSQNGQWETDTIFNGIDRMEIDNPTMSSPAMASAKNHKSSEAVPQASANAKNKDALEEEFPMENLADHKVESKKSSMYHNPKRFEEMVKNTKYHMGQIKFYPGVVVGATYNATNNNIVGAQFGLAMDVSVGDRWGILTEAKYIYRYNGKANLQNDYISNVEQKYINGSVVYTYDSIQHSYNFNSFGSLEIPLAVKYSANRITGFGGVNLNYNFKINNVDEVEVKHFKEIEAVSTNTNIYNKVSDKTVLLSDFAPSFGVGYVLGVGYDVKPAIRLDMRVSQPIWNSSSTTGQKELYKQLYSMPSMQFNVRYRFGNNSMKPYKR